MQYLLQDSKMKGIRTKIKNNKKTKPMVKTNISKKTTVKIKAKM
jgi:hypothetical protein